MTDTATDHSALTIPGIEDIKCRIQPLLISRKYYDEKLSDLVSSDFLDLKVCYYIPDDDSIRLISNKLLNAQNIPADFIRSQALENIRSSCSYGIIDLAEALTHMCAPKILDTPDLRSPFPIYVLTTAKGFLGATGLLLDSLLADLANLIENSFFILPSSIHEVLLVPEGNGMDIRSLSEMVRAVNKSEVSPQEALSDHAYHYDRKTRQIRTE